MTAVRLSSGFQIKIPTAIRRQFKLQAGQVFEVVAYEGHITLIPLGSMKDLRGIARGIESRVPRDADRT